jgi:hypothetical protein
MAELNVALASAFAGGGGAQAAQYCFLEPLWHC